VARGVREAVLEGFDDPRLEVLIVWVDVVTSDGGKGAARAAQLFHDPRVRQFHDPDLLAARAFAPCVGMPSMRGVAKALDLDLADLEDAYRSEFLHGEAALYDTALLFGPEARWPAGEDDGESTSPGPPPPRAWVTQLDPAMYVGIDPTRFRFGEELREELALRTAALLKELGKGAPSER